MTSPGTAAFCAALGQGVGVRRPLAELVVVKVVPSSLRITVALLRALALILGDQEVA